MKVLYVAGLRQTVGVGEEDVEPPAEVDSVRGLIDWLRSRSARHATAFAKTALVRAAVNQEHVSFDHPIAAGDEVAFFPPVTGGAR